MTQELTNRQPATRRAFAGLVAAGALALAAAAPGPLPEVRTQPPTLDVPYVPTPDEVVDKMLDLAQVRPGDSLIDLGSGDGRIPVTAAQRFGITAFGVDIDPRRVAEANERAARAGVTDKVKFEVRNLFDTKISDATVLTLYLLPRVNLELRPRILSELRPGTRVVSHQFDMGDWKPDHIEKVGHRTIYMWTVPARVEGRWNLTRADGAGIGLDLAQDKANVSGSAVIEGRQVPLKNAAVEGERIRFEIATGRGQPLR